MNALIINENYPPRTPVNNQCEAVYIFNTLSLLEAFFDLLLACFPDLSYGKIPVYFSRELEQDINLGCSVYSGLSVEEAFQHYHNVHLKERNLVNRKSFMDKLAA